MSDPLTESTDANRLAEALLALAWPHEMCWCPDEWRNRNASHSQECYAAIEAMRLHDNIITIKKAIRLHDDIIAIEQETREPTVVAVAPPFTSERTTDYYPCSKPQGHEDDCDNGPRSTS